MNLTIENIFHRIDIGKSLQLRKELSFGIAFQFLFTALGKCWDYYRIKNSVPNHHFFKISKFYKLKNKEPNKYSKLEPLVNRIKRLCQKSGITRDINLVYGASQYQASSGVLGITGPMLHIPDNDASSFVNKLSSDEMDGLICHELSHIKHYDDLLPLFLMISIETINLALMTLYPGLALMLIYETLFITGSFFLFLLSSLQRRLEKRADKESVKVLGTAKGLITYFARMYNYYGNNPNDHTHPKLSDRIKYLSKMDPKAVVKFEPTKFSVIA